MKEHSDGDVVGPVTDDLDPHTIRAVQHAIRGFSATNPEQSPTEMTDYREGQHRAYSSVMAVLSQWLDDIENENEEKN